LIFIGSLSSSISSEATTTESFTSGEFDLATQNISHAESPSVENDLRSHGLMSDQAFLIEPSDCCVQ